jgi:NAD(P)H-flavin reductase
MYLIKEKVTINETVDLMSIEAPLVAKNAKPGQFIILMVNPEGERVPLTIVETKNDDVVIIYQKLGYTTKLLGTKEAGDFISDFVGPLGKAAHIHECDHLLAVAGGIGAAPLLPQLREYSKRGTKIDLVIGAKSFEYLILLDEFEKVCENVYCCTDDGSYGHKGFVTQKAEELLLEKKYDQAVTIGPLIMMKNVVLLHKKYNLKTDVSLNPIMIDGTGMCGNCRVSIGGKTFFACVDGPDFPGDEVDFNELLVRQNMYKKEEHTCNLERYLK